MKLKLTKTFNLANPEVWKPHWEFTKDQLLDTDNEYLIDRLLILKCAKLIDKEQTKKTQIVQENKMLQDIENKELIKSVQVVKKKVVKKKNAPTTKKDD